MADELVKLDSWSLEVHNIGAGKGILMAVMYAASPDWWDIATFSFAQALLLAAAFAALVLVVLKLARRLRGDADDDRLEAGRMLTKFRELHARGGLSDEEFRTIKTKLVRQFQNELRDDEETGLDDRTSHNRPSD